MKTRRSLFQWLGGVRSGLVMIAGSMVLLSAAMNSAGAESNPKIPDTDRTTMLRVGIAPGSWQGLNRNDATAAIHAWARSILKQSGISLSVDTKLFETKAALANALKQGTIDCASISSDQFLELDPKLQPDDIYLAVKNNSVTDCYVLLANPDSGIRTIQDLRHRKLLYLSTSRSSLCLPWLEWIFATNSMKSPKEEMLDISPVEKPSKAVLSVYFHQVDACLVTSNAFALSGELNPQLLHSLKIVDASPQFVPALFFFRKGCPLSIRNTLEPAILKMHESTAGLQVLMAFQCDRMIKGPISMLDGVKTLMSSRDQARRNGGLPSKPAATSMAGADH